MRAVLITSVLVATLTFTQCKKGIFCVKGKGTSTTKTYDLNPFTHIDLRLDADVTLTPGATQEVKVTAQQNILDELDLSVASGELVIGESKCLNDHDRITIEITLPDLQGIDMNSVGNIVTNGTFISPRLDVVHKETGDVDLSVALDLLVVDHRGEGNLTMTGNSGYQELNVIGAGSYKAFALQSDTCFIVSAASANCEILVDSFLDVKVLSSGNVLSKGHPTIIQHIDGSGQLIDSN